MFRQLLHSFRLDCIIAIKARDKVEQVMQKVGDFDTSESVPRPKNHHVKSPIDDLKIKMNRRASPCMLCNINTEGRSSYFPKSPNFWFAAYWFAACRFLDAQVQTLFGKE